MTFEQQLELYLRARCTLLVLMTPEEDRAVRAVRHGCDPLRRSCLSWAVADHFQPLTPGAVVPTALEQIDKADGDGIFVLRDFHDCWDNVQVKRKLRGVAQRLRFTRKSILVTTPAGKRPEELKDDAVLYLPPPGPPELEAVLDRLTRESEGYVGAELEQAVIDATDVGFGAGREFTSEDVSAALKRQVQSASEMDEHERP